MMRASGDDRADAVARGRFAVLRQIGFEQIALRLGIAFERAQLHVLLVARCRLPLSWSRPALIASTLSLASLASFSSERASRSASPRICRSRSPICARNSLMRGCWSSSVEDCSASCARSVTRCSVSRRISSELTMSENSIGVAGFQGARGSVRAFASASAFCARAAASCALNSPSCWFDSVVLLVPMNRLVLARYFSTLASASATLLAQPLDLAGEPVAGAARLVLLGGLLQQRGRSRRSHWRPARQARDPPTRIRSRSRATSRPGRRSAGRSSS